MKYQFVYLNVVPVLQSATSHPIGRQGGQQRPDHARGEGHTEPANSWLVESASHGWILVFLEMGKDGIQLIFYYITHFCIHILSFCLWILSGQNGRFSRIFHAFN